MAKEDLAGKVFGSLTVLQKSTKSGTGVFYTCLCARCGGTKDIRATKLRNGSSTTCGCSKITEDLTDRQFDRISVIGRAKNKGKQACWNCVCSCGTELVISGSSLRRGLTKSCGCLRLEVAVENGRATKTHGMDGTPTYRSWSSMKVRCLNEDHISFPNYGGRGISVCERWLVFQNFLDDMGPRPEGTTLDRINNNGNYEPSNCRWATATIQHRNTRVNRILEINGEQITAAELADRTGIDRGTFLSRLNRGWSVEDAVNRPVDQRRLSNPSDL